MILARCPDCATTFRVTPDQLKARGGKVRCGQCKTVFNALDALVEETREVVPHPPRDEALPVPAAEIRQTVVEPPAIYRQLDETSPKERELDVSDAAAATRAFIDATESAAPRETEAPPLPPEAEPATPDAHEPTTVAASVPDAAATAVRQVRELPGYSKWAERPVDDDKRGFSTPERAARWPSAVFALILLLALAAQSAYQFRGEIAVRVPQARPWLVEACAAIGCTLPLPRQTESISIEGSELQSDPARGGLLVLQATLRNRAAIAQAYPALELTLTDTQDRMVVRRVLAPADYLPAAAEPGGAFAAASDLAIKLWLDAGDSGAAGYRLYVFYP